MSATELFRARRLYPEYNRRDILRGIVREMLPELIKEFADLRTNEKFFYNNKLEQNFAELARTRGWSVTKRGWPDFICKADQGTTIAVEVKPRSQRTGKLQTLRPEQVECFDWFESIGIECYISDGVDIERYDYEKHGGGK